MCFFLKFTVERLLGFLIGFFGPVIGYDYETVRETAANKKGKALGIRPKDRLPNGDRDDANKARFSCDLKIHKYEHAFESFNSARRMTMMPPRGDGRRMSVSSDRLYHQQQPHPNLNLQSRQLSDNNLNLAASMDLRRSSMAPGTLESMMAKKSRHFSSGSSRDYDERESVIGSGLALGDDASELQAMMNNRESEELENSYEEDNSELLSMQVETYMDTK